jgi:hypothetical protein
MVLGLLLTACQPETIVETVVVTEIVTEIEEVIVTQEVEVIKTEIVEVPVEPTEKTVVEFWTTDNEEDRVNVYEDVAARFMEENPYRGSGCLTTNCYCACS